MLKPPDWSFICGFFRLDFFETPLNEEKNKNQVILCWISRLRKNGNFLFSLSLSFVWGNFKVVHDGLGQSIVGL